MIQKIFSIFDSKAEAFITPFFSQSTGTAIREFSAAANDMEHQFFKYGGDYSLFELGSFDQGSAVFDILKAPINLGLAISFVESVPSPISSIS